MLNKRIEKLYQNFKVQILAETDNDKLILKTQELVFFCWMNYPLRFTDKEIEDKVTQAMLPPVATISQSGKNHVVYIATTVFEVGGHSRCIINFIDNIKDKKHSVILTSQKKGLPANIEAFFQQNGVDCFMLSDKEKPTEKARALREKVIELAPSEVFLFHHANDLLPLMAFGNYKPCKITLYNHGDHIFWLAGKWFTEVFDFRKIGAMITKYGRSVAETKIVCLPVSNEYELADRSVSKQKIGLNSGNRIIGTLTNISKIQPFKSEQSIVQLILNWAIDLPHCTFMIIGISSGQFKQLVASTVEIPDNIKCLGIVADPEMYYQAFDFFIEPYPMGSGLGIIEACKYGAIPVFSAHPCKLASSFEAFHESIQHLFKQPASAAELNSDFYEILSRSDDELFALSKTVRELIYRHHRGSEWVQSLHAPSAIVDYVVDVKAEAGFFQVYLGKTAQVLFNDLLKLKQLVTKPVIRTFFIGKYAVYSIFSLSFKNWKQLGFRLMKD